MLSGIDGSLRLVERLAGADTARRVAREIRWSGYLPGEDIAIPQSSPGPGDLPAVLSAAFRWDRPHDAVLVSSGIGETELSSAFRPYTELSYLATLETLSATGAPVTTAHGVTVVPTRSVDEVSGIDRLVVPGRDAADRQLGDHGQQLGFDVDYLHTRDEFAYDGAIRDIAARYDRATARWVAKSLQFDTSAHDDGGTAWPWRLTAVALGLFLLIAAGMAILGGAAFRAVTALRHRSRPVDGSSSATPTSADTETTDKEPVP
ncbi:MULTISPECIES: hypothetical protein [Gordonia]|uniref:Uncharacterized protein n=1 Tax=Gordonia tangerina TaxID=2911060 RepID=A0ABS9DPM2_9ACTN|nr:hypothetical protein [Gordonia tangerina]MCF3941164.1 hypothetical protein [Gordonia tangerina]